MTLGWRRDGQKTEKCPARRSPTALPPPLPPPALRGFPSIPRLTSVLGSSRERVPWSSWLTVPGSGCAPFGTRGGPSPVTHFDSAEKLFTVDVSVSKPAPCPSPTHYTFGIVSYTGVNHTEDLEEPDSCERLHNA